VIGSAEASAEAVQDAADAAKLFIPEGVSLWVDSADGVQKDVRCINREYEKKKLKANVKSVNVSVSAPGVDPS
jgi:hypothetical protein